MTPDTFGEAAARLCSVASMVLGWRPGEFWDATPAEMSLALQAPEGVSGGPDRLMIEDLRKRFPDD